MPDRNASYTLFGWDFQINAAIFIFLKNIKEIEKLRLEGKLQDIEIVKNDKSKIYAQAKAIYRYDDYANVVSNLKSALASLNESKQKDSDCNEIIYVTNTPNPFNKDMGYFSGVTNLKYDDLPETCKTIFNTIKDTDSLTALDTAQFSIQVIPFHGKNLDNRYKHIKELVSEFLASLNLSDRGFTSTLLGVWQNEIFKNGTIPDTSIHIKKSELIWPLVFLVTDQASDEWIADELDEGVYEEIKSKYYSIINNATDRFEVYTKIVTSFQEYEFKGTNREKVKNFINDYWRNFVSDIDGNNSLSLEEQEYVIKIIIHKILVKKEYISKIKVGAGL